MPVGTIHEVVAPWRSLQTWNHQTDDSSLSCLLLPTTASLVELANHGVQIVGRYMYLRHGGRRLRGKVQLWSACACGLHLTQLTCLHR